MKKLTKILASVLTLSMAMSTVVMPISVKAEDYGTKYAWLSFADSSDATYLTNATQANGLGGKVAEDKVALISGAPGTIGGEWGEYWSEEIMTAEVQAYVSTGKIELYPGSNPGNEDRPGIVIQSGVLKFVKANGWAYTDICQVTTNAWHKIAITWNRTEGTAMLYLDGELKSTQTGLNYASKGFVKDIRVQNDGYVDNYHVYAGAYNPDNDVMPKEIAGSNLTFLVGDTVADAKNKILAAQDESVRDKVVARVYSDNIYGTEITDDTEALREGWSVVVTSKSGDLYESGKVYKVVKDIEIMSATLNAGVLEVDVTNKKPVESMMMVLVQNNGKFVKASNVVTNVSANNGFQFVITDLGDTLSQAEVFFVKSWDELAPMLDSITPIN